MVKVQQIKTEMMCYGTEVEGVKVPRPITQNESTTIFNTCINHIKEIEKNSLNALHLIGSAKKKLKLPKFSDLSTDKKISFMREIENQCTSICQNLNDVPYNLREGMEKRACKTEGSMFKKKACKFSVPSTISVSDKEIATFKKKSESEKRKSNVPSRLYQRNYFTNAFESSYKNFITNAGEMKHKKFHYNPKLIQSDSKKETPKKELIKVDQSDDFICEVKIPVSIHEKRYKKLPSMTNMNFVKGPNEKHSYEGKGCIISSVPSYLEQESEMRWEQSLKTRMTNNLICEPIKGSMLKSWKKIGCPTIKTPKDVSRYAEIKSMMEKSSGQLKQNYQEILNQMEKNQVERIVGVQIRKAPIKEDNATFGSTLKLNMGNWNHRDLLFDIGKVREQSPIDKKDVESSYKIQERLARERMKIRV